MRFLETIGRLAGPARSALIVAVMTLVFFVALEGISSLVLLVRDVATQSRRPLSSHSRYDPVLGWVNSPNVDLPDLYGPGIGFRTNSQGFRGDRDYPAAVPPGKTRIVCSGDSFTLGHGVSDEDAWCHVLGTLDDRLETVNMGNGGYGLDQAYLWYLRDGAPLRHDVLLFSFITEDFFRVSQDRFLGYPKPVLGVRDGRLVPLNVPLPRRSFYLPWLTRNAGLFYRLRTLQLYQSIFGSGARAAPDPRRAAEIASRIFADLEKTTRERGSALVLVYLPVAQDYGDPASDRWRDFVRRDAERRGIPFIDLVEEIRRIPPEEAARLFADHYSPEGNRFVAKTLHARLRGLPGLSGRLPGAGE
jgi:hypothetical protein